MTVRLLAEAADDVAELADWYDQLRGGLGVRFRASIGRLVGTLGTHPRLFGRVRGAPRGRELRIATTHRFRAKVVYEVTATEIVILSIVHARSNRRPWRNRLDNP